METSSVFVQISDFSALKGALRSVLKIALRLWRKDNMKVITMKWSSPNQSRLENLVSKSYAEPINDAIFDGIFKSGDIRIRRSRNEV